MLFIKKCYNAIRDRNAQLLGWKITMVRSKQNVRLGQKMLHSQCFNNLFIPPYQQACFVPQAHTEDVFEGQNTAAVMLV